MIALLKYQCLPCLSRWPRVLSVNVEERKRLNGTTNQDLKGKNEMSLVMVVLGRLPTPGMKVKRVLLYYSVLLFTSDKYLDIIDTQVRQYRSVSTIALMAYHIIFCQARD